MPQWRWQAKRPTARKAEVSREFGLSRPTVYEARNTAGEVLREHFEKAASAYRVVRVDVDDAQLERAVVALRVTAPNAIRPIEELLPILYPGVRVAYGRFSPSWCKRKHRRRRSMDKLTSRR